MLKSNTIEGDKNTGNRKRERNIVVSWKYGKTDNLGLKN